MPILSLLIFGGETLKDFAFALMIGIASGAYSSIFIAAPLLCWWKEREPEYARRRDADGLEGITSVGGMLEAAEELAADQPTPEIRPGPPQALMEQAGDVAAGAASKREQRRKRRNSRPHGRAR